MATLADRRKQFRAALALSGLTAAEWARSEGEVSPEHLSYVLNGRRVSGALNERIDAFVARTLGGFPRRRPARAA